MSCLALPPLQQSLPTYPSQNFSHSLALDMISLFNPQLQPQIASFQQLAPQPLPDRPRSLSPIVHLPEQSGEQFLRDLQPNSMPSPPASFDLSPASFFPSPDINAFHPLLVPPPPPVVGVAEMSFAVSPEVSSNYFSYSS